jgi:hypothetical protein
MVYPTVENRSWADKAIVVADSIVNPRERQARRIALAAAILNAIWLVVVLLRVPAVWARGDGSMKTLVVLFVLNASAFYSLLRRAIIPRSPERFSQSWKDRINPWNVSLVATGVWLYLALLFRPSFWMVYASVVGATLLLSLAGRRVDGRPYR